MGLVACAQTQATPVAGLWRAQAGPVQDELRLQGDGRCTWRVVHRMPDGWSDGLRVDCRHVANAQGVRITVPDESQAIELIWAPGADGQRQLVLTGPEPRSFQRID